MLSAAQRENASVAIELLRIGLRLFLGALGVVGRGDVVERTEHDLRFWKKRFWRSPQFLASGQYLRSREYKRSRRSSARTARQRAGARRMSRWSKGRRRRLCRKINRFYAQTPPGMSVDHIVPLHGQQVSGLHLPCNLQYLTVEENDRKNNHYTPAWEILRPDLLREGAV